MSVIFLKFSQKNNPIKPKKTEVFIGLIFEIVITCKLAIDQLTEIVIGVCIKIHSKIGPGCFEKVYEEILYYELTKLGLKVQRQLILPLVYESLNIKKAYKIDLLVEDMLVIELKTLETLPSVYFTQIRTQLSLMSLKYGMLLNFKVNRMTEGINRVYNNHGREKL